MSTAIREHWLDWLDKHIWPQIQTMMLHDAYFKLLGRARQLTGEFSGPVGWLVEVRDEFFPFFLSVIKGARPAGARASAARRLAPRKAPRPRFAMRYATRFCYRHTPKSRHKNPHKIRAKPAQKHRVNRGVALT
jgi:hypothetical protein